MKATTDRSTGQQDVPGFTPADEALVDQLVEMWRRLLYETKYSVIFIRKHPKQGGRWIRVGRSVVDCSTLLCYGAVRRGFTHVFVRMPQSSDPHAPHLLHPPSAIVTAIFVAVAGFLIWIAVQDTEPIPVPTDMTAAPRESEGD